MFEKIKGFFEHKYCYLGLSRHQRVLDKNDHGFHKNITVISKTATNQHDFWRIVWHWRL